MPEQALGGIPLGFEIVVIERPSDLTLNGQNLLPVSRDIVPIPPTFLTRSPWERKEKRSPLSKE